ncbi:MAG: glutamine--fructose-6-phosphate transaminase (isomerizing), partial [Eubacterium sp.]
SPIVTCKGDDGTYLSSDIIALGEYCKRYFVLDENTIAVLKPDGVKAFDFSMNETEVSLLDLDYHMVKAEKNGYPFFMEKEIAEQPEVIENALKSRINNNLPDFSADDIDDSFFDNINKISFIACGTAMHACLIGKELINFMARIPCDVFLASEYMYSNPIIDKGTLIICISQSGETIDTLEALKFAKRSGAKSLSIINVKNSSIARESDRVIYTNAGTEIAVASTKAYTTQVAVLYLICAKLAELKGKLSKSEIGKFITELQKIPKAVKSVLDRKKEIHRLSKKVIDAEHAFMIGRGLDYPALLEASLKLKEISYIHSEAFASGELKHGTIALITEKTPVIALITQSHLKSKEISNIKEVQSRGANVITIIKKSLNDGAVKCNFELPDLTDELMTIPAVTAMQLFAYYVSSDKGLDVDKPRNLAKVVTVE